MSEVDAQHSESRSQKSRQGAAHTPIQFHDVAAKITRFGCPQNIDPNKFTLITPFSSARDDWMNSKCVNVHDQQSPVYDLTNEYDGRRALPKNFFMLLDSYRNHPEAKSLGPDRNPCDFKTHVCYRGRTLLRTGRLFTLGRNRTGTGKRGRFESAGIQSYRVQKKRKPGCDRGSTSAYCKSAQTRIHAPWNQSAHA